MGPQTHILFYSAISGQIAKSRSTSFSLFLTVQLAGVVSALAPDAELLGRAVKNVVDGLPATHNFHLPPGLTSHVCHSLFVWSVIGILAWIGLRHWPTLRIVALSFFAGLGTHIILDAFTHGPPRPAGMTYFWPFSLDLRVLSYLVGGWVYSRGNGSYWPKGPEWIMDLVLMVWLGKIWRDKIGEFWQTMKLGTILKQSAAAD